MDVGKGKVLERLSRWDASAESLAPLDDSMMKGVAMLEANAAAFPPIPRYCRVLQMVTVTVWTTV